MNFISSDDLRCFCSFSETVFGHFSFPECASFTRNNIHVRVFECPDPDNGHKYFCIFEFMMTGSFYFTFVSFHSLHSAIDTMQKWIDNYDYNPFENCEVNNG